MIPNMADGSFSRISPAFRMSLLMKFFLETPLPAPGIPPRSSAVLPRQPDPPGHWRYHQKICRVVCGRCGNCPAFRTLFLYAAEPFDFATGENQKV